VRYIIAHLPRNIHITANSAPPAKLFARGPPPARSGRVGPPDDKNSHFLPMRKSSCERGERGGGNPQPAKPPGWRRTDLPAPPRPHPLSLSEPGLSSFCGCFRLPLSFLRVFLALWRPLVAVFRDPAGLVSTTPGSGAGCCVCVCVRPTGPPSPARQFFEPGAWGEGEGGRGGVGLFNAL
jgi:hypothetical protein